MTIAVLTTWFVIISVTNLFIGYLVGKAVAHARTQDIVARTLRDAAEDYSCEYRKASAEAMREAYDWLNRRADKKMT